MPEPLCACAGQHYAEAQDVSEQVTLNSSIMVVTHNLDLRGFNSDMRLSKDGQALLLRPGNRFAFQLDSSKPQSRGDPYSGTALFEVRGLVVSSS